MQVIEKEEFEQKKENIIYQIKRGSVFIYPTDTIYGIGCNAMIDNAVQKVRDIKSRYTRPFSVIAPSVQWIRDNFVVDEKAEEWLAQLPGPLTLILNIKTEGIVSELVNAGLKTVGVRIPDHWFSKVVEEIGYPIITTSANHVGEDYMTNLDDLNSEIKNKVEFTIYEGEKQGRPSKIVHLEKEEVKIKER
jgi:L-threonylcarbamoyladenylate synthase